MRKEKKRKEKRGHGAKGDAKKTRDYRELALMNERKRMA